jgi:transposase
MSVVHVNAPKPVNREVVKFHCSNCDVSREGLGEYYEWYGYELTCLTCGDVYTEDGRRERPFERGWRKKSVEDARKRLERHLLHSNSNRA